MKPTIQQRAADLNLRVVRLLKRDAYDHGGNTWALVHPATGPGRIVQTFRTLAELAQHIEDRT